MQYYFDESGDLGNISNRSNTNFFVIAIYRENSPEETRVIFDKIRTKLQIDSKVTEVKWRKLHKSQKNKFENIFHGLLDHKLFLIYCDKAETNSLSIETFTEMIKSLISNFSLFGKYKFEGLHLSRYLEKTRKEFKINNKKVSFQNSDTKKNPGIQICDLAAGFIHYKRERKEEVNFKNVIKFKF